MAIGIKINEDKEIEDVYDKTHEENITDEEMNKTMKLMKMSKFLGEDMVASKTIKCMVKKIRNNLWT